MTEREKLTFYLGGKGIGKTTYVKQLLKGKKWIDLRSVNTSDYISLKDYIGVVDVYDPSTTLTNYRVFDQRKAISNILEFFDKGGKKVIIVTHTLEPFKEILSSYNHDVIELDLRHVVDQILGNKYSSEVKKRLKEFSYGYAVGAKYLKLLNKEVNFESPEDIIREYIKSLNVEPILVKIRGKLGVLPRSIVGENILSQKLELLVEEVLEDMAKDLGEEETMLKLQDIILRFDEECIRQAFLVSVTVSKAGYLCDKCPQLCVEHELPLSIRQAVLYPSRITLRLPFRGCGRTSDDAIRYGSSDREGVCSKEILSSITKYVMNEFSAQVLHEYLGRFYADKANDTESLRALGVYVRTMSLYLRDKILPYAEKIMDKGDWIAKSLILPYLVDVTSDAKPFIATICMEGIEQCKVALIDGGIDELNARYDRDLDLSIRKALSDPPILVKDYTRYLGIDTDKWLVIRKEYYESTLGKFLVYAGYPDEAQKHLIHCVNSEIMDTMVNCRILWAKTMVLKGQDVSEYTKELWNEVKNKVEILPQTKAIVLSFYVVSNDDSVTYEAYSHLLRHVPYVKVLVDCYFGSCNKVEFALVTAHKDTMVPAIMYKLGEISQEQAFEECINTSDITECDNYVLNPNKAVEDVLNRTIPGKMLLSGKLNKKELLLSI
ncbi:hypothetical protein [Stygiolobus azoricus]|uniref:Uncharacterized protein n=1 Tax=Stygiolobus azoricus TaxID=41675 RepID=A0A650CLP9_9CREN|nr:hypothetical protein [Stygiolobus azoricus]QGR18602.1 hypothetical protein D1868_00375 [Stygiolobus azoricus]